MPVSFDRWKLEISLTWEEIYGYKLRSTSDKCYKITEEISKKLLEHLPNEIIKYKDLNYLGEKFMPILIKRIKKRWS